MDVKNVKTCVFGVQGSGKSHFVENYLLKRFANPIVYLMHEEDFQSHDDGAKIIVPKDEEGNVDVSMKTLNKICKKIKERAIAGEVDAFVIDEADLFIKKDFRQLQNYSYFQDLVINHRHYGLALVFITRRPQELPTAITEQSAHYFIFSIGGKNVKDYLNRIHDRLGDYAYALDKDEYKFLHLEFGKRNPLTKYNKVSVSEEKKNININIPTADL